MMWNNPGWVGWILMGIGMLAVWAIVVAGLVALTSRTPRHLRRQADGDDPETILARRFAAGELTAVQYQASRDLLHHG